MQQQLTVSPQATDGSISNWVGVWNSGSKGYQLQVRGAKDSAPASPTNIQDSWREFSPSRPQAAIEEQRVCFRTRFRHLLLGSRAGRFSRRLEAYECGA